MRHVAMLLLVGVLFVPQAAWAAKGKVRCGLHHFVRVNGTEIRAGSIRLSNGDLVNSVTIERLTIYDFFGDVVHDSGPAIGVPHPLNTDTTLPTDITVVPPGANYFIRTNHIWGNNPIPDTGGKVGNQRGQLMGIVVEFSKSGQRKLFNVASAPRTRQRFFDGQIFREGAETTLDSEPCFDVRIREVDEDDD